MYLYLDTTFGSVIGILKSNFEWLDYFENSDQKNASTLHSEIEKLCSRNQIQINHLKGLVQVAGPGGYTGLRVSDGISQTFSWFGFPTFSFYHFEILGLMGIKHGLWLSNAFKGELFCYDQSIKKSSLIKEPDWFNHLPQGQLFTHYFEAFSPTAKAKLNISHFTETSALIKSHPQTIFSPMVSEGRKRELFYYRPIEQEFTKPTSPKI